MELRRRIFSWMIVSGFLLIPAHLSCAEVLIYIGKGGSFKGTKIDDGIIDEMARHCSKNRRVLDS